MSFLRMRIRVHVCVRMCVHVLVHVFVRVYACEHWCVFLCDKVLTMLIEHCVFTLSLALARMLSLPPFLFLSPSLSFYASKSKLICFSVRMVWANESGDFLNAKIFSIYD